MNVCKNSLFWIKEVPGKVKPFCKNSCRRYPKTDLTFKLALLPGVDNFDDLVSRRTKVTKLVNDPTWLLGPKWLSLPSKFWLKSDEVIDENQLDSRKNPDTLQCACITEEF